LNAPNIIDGAGKMARFRGGLGLGVAAAMAAFAGPAFASGFHSQEQSVRGLGEAHSGEAAESGADMLWWNPAATAGTDGGEVYLGVNGVLADASVRDGGSTIQRPFAPVLPVGGTSPSDPVSAAMAPTLAVAAPLGGRWSLALSVTTPFEFVTSVEPQSWTRYQALSLRMVDLDVQPTLAVRATPWLDLGVGFDAQYVESRLTTLLPNVSPLLPDGQAVVRGKGWDFGWVVGATVRPGDRLTLGLSYRSGIDHHLAGEVTTSGLAGPLAVGNGVVPSTTRFATPWIATLGLRWRASDRWSLSAQVQRSGWSGFDTIQVDRPGSAPQPSRQTRDTTSLAVGVTYAASPRWTFRGGIQYDPQAIKDSAMLADGDRRMVAVGATWRAGSRLSIDLAAAYVAFKTSPIDSDATAYRGTALQTPITLVGAFSAKAPILSAGLRYRF
jgi:long-chain fatty acid transport protein